MSDAKRADIEKAVWVDPERMNGAPCFRNTRVPIQSLIDFLEHGETVERFLALYPAVISQQVLAVLDFGRQQLTEYTFTPEPMRPRLKLLYS